MALEVGTGKQYNLCGRDAEEAGQWERVRPVSTQQARAFAFLWSLQAEPETLLNGYDTIERRGLYLLSSEAGSTATLLPKKHSFEAQLPGPIDVRAWVGERKGHEQNLSQDSTQLKTHQLFLYCVRRLRRSTKRVYGNYTIRELLHMKTAS